MRRLLPLFLLLAACASPPRVPFTDAAAASAFEAAPAYAESTSHGVMHTVLLYIPNRIFDLFDIVRARLRLGPGFALSAHATKLAGAGVGAYTAVWVGIPGPRLEPALNLPVGAEAMTKAGVTAAGADVGVGVSGGVTYGIAEFEVGFQAAIIGLDVGVDPWEAVDFLCGIVTYDPVGDDL